LCRRDGTEDETSAHILCECEAVAALRHVYLGHYKLEVWGPSGTLAKEQGSPELESHYGAQKVRF